MCGIAGVLGFSSDDFGPDLARMSSALLHRGPDSSGEWVDRDAGVGLAHRRLSIVDISEAGHQPMVSPSGRFVVCYNGEIYNHLELRTELLKVDGNIRWRGHSDTETLVVAIDTWGLDAAVSRLVGMFAFALWDRKDRVLHLCRDRVGEKPLYFGTVKARDKQNGKPVSRFVFASELKALSIPGIERTLSREALVLYFRYHYIPAPYSIYEGVYKLEPGCIATVKKVDAEPEIRQYWSPISSLQKAQANQFSGSIAEAADEVERLLRQSIEGQLIADVPVGAFLSGGIDSSTTVSLMQKVKGSQVNTFSIGFTDNDFNEAPYARQISDVLGTNHTELYLSDKDVEGLITDVPGIVDEPFADSSLLPTYAVSRLARQSVTVSLSGDGGDELFGGYTRYPTTAQAIRAKNRMGLAGKLFSSAMINSRLAGLDYTGRPVWPLGLNQHAVMRKLATALYALNQPDDASVYRGQVSFWRDPRTPVLGPGQAKCKFQNPQCWVDAEDVQESIQMMDIQTFLPDDILCKVDRAAMSVSLETRVPMLDHRFMEFVWSLPLSYRSSGRTQSAVQKKILKDIVARSVPAALMDRPKKGFGVPIGKWIRGPLRDWSESLLDVNTLKSQGLLDPAIVGTCWGVTKNNSDADAEFIWSILVLQQWLSQEKIST